MHTHLLPCQHNSRLSPLSLSLSLSPSLSLSLTQTGTFFFIDSHSHSGNVILLLSFFRAWLYILSCSVLAMGVEPAVSVEILPLHQTSDLSANQGMLSQSLLGT